MAMKKLVLVLFLALLLSVSISQQRAILPLELKDYSVKVDYIRPFVTSAEVPGYKGPNQLQTATAGGTIIEETVIGTTFYDLQSNASLSNRIHCYEDGTIGAVWTMGLEATSFPDRGTGYNYFNGSTWGVQPQQRIETFRSGWPSYAPWGADGEIIVSHDFSAFDLYFNSRPQKGTGTWTQTLFEYSNGPTTLAWPRMTTSGEDHNTIHLLASTYGAYLGQTVGVVYSRSLDGGATWDTENEVLDGMGSDYYLEINADQYIWANPVGETIAFLVASAWHDLFMMKSTDNGESWEKTVIWEHPYPFFDWNVTITDTFFCVDNSAGIALDNSGMAHVVFGINRVIHEAVGTGYSYYPGVDGIGYWNESMETFSSDLNALAPPQYGYENTELEENYNYIGWTQDVDGDGEITFVNTSTGFPMAYREMGISTMPTISISPDNWIVVIYASTTETYDNFDWNYKKLWMRDKQEGGTWGPIVHLTEDIAHIFDESIYPVAYPAWDGSVHLLYNNDGAPGTALDGDHDYIENRATYMKVELYQIGIDEGKLSGIKEESLVISPNPTEGYVKINYSINEDALVKFSIADISGKTLMEKTLGYKKAGDYSNTLDLSGLKNGIYFIHLKHGNSVITQKVIKH
jgi:hypothetical protein